MNVLQKSRRALLASWATIAGSAIIGGKATAAGLLHTPQATEGPFYPKPKMRPDDIDNDLVKVLGSVTEAGGEVIELTGRIVDVNGKPLEGLRVEIWQCDVNGKYLHTGDSRKLAYDKAFQGFGHDISTSTGEYRFRTIKPTPYPGRTPHIHVKVCRGDEELLTSQFYLKDEPANTRDSLFRRMSEEEAAAVSMEFNDGEQWPVAIVDIVV
ncbi:MAG: intradiol ring-cleavage dioxygenase [Granulosicoccus sp.]|nr:intradiol ring-cleavage dioxygenase [Granulosicoccus sp.]